MRGGTVAGRDGLSLNCPPELGLVYGPDSNGFGLICFVGGMGLFGAILGRVAGGAQRSELHWRRR